MIHTPRLSKNESGFSLIEMMISVAVISVIAVIANMFFSGYMKKQDYNDKRADMFRRLEQLEKRITHELSRLNLTSQTLILTTQTGSACVSNCPNLTFTIEKVNDSSSTVRYSTSCTPFPPRPVNPKDISQTVATCVKCGSGTHAAIIVTKDGVPTKYDLTETTGGLHNRYSAGSTICTSLTPDAIRINLAMGIVNEAGDVKELKKEVYIPRRNAENLQLLGQ
jgi:prepilin-type N-terminal cleavage/methylation domain-containing protein